MYEYHLFGLFKTVMVVVSIAIFLAPLRTLVAPNPSPLVTIISISLPSPTPIPIHNRWNVIMFLTLEKVKGMMAAASAH